MTIVKNGLGFLSTKRQSKNHFSSFTLVFSLIDVIIVFSYEELEVAKMIKIHWLKIVGTYDDTSDLTPGAKYEAVFLVKLEDNAIGWEQPVTLKLKVEQHDGSDDNRVDRNESLKDYIGHNWVDILAGVFVAPPRNKPAKITFTMFQHVTDDKKKGLVVKGVAIRPTN